MSTLLLKATQLFYTLYGLLHSLLYYIHYFKNLDYSRGSSSIADDCQRSRNYSSQPRDLRQLRARIFSLSERWTETRAQPAPRQQA
jgi:hypothetical protein